MGYTLRDVTDELYKQTRPEQFYNEDILKNFYVNESKKFNECIRSVDLEEEIEWIKNGGVFSFNESDRNFWITILKEHTNKMDPIRRATNDGLDNGFVVSLFEGIIDVFRNAEIEDEKLSKVAHKMNNRLNYSICKHKYIIESMQNKMKNLIEENIDTISLDMGINEKNQWLIGLEHDFSGFISKWSDLFFKMGEIRNCEIVDISEQEANSMSPQQTYEVLIDFNIAEPFLDRLNQNEEYNILCKERNKMLGISDGEKTIRKSKKPHVVKVEKRFRLVNQRLNEIVKETEQQVISEFYPGHKNKKEEFESPDFSSLMSTEELLKKAIKQQKEDWDEEDNKTPLIYLPDIDFEDVRRQWEYMKLSNSEI